MPNKRGSKNVNWGAIADLNRSHQELSNGTMKIWNSVKKKNFMFITPPFSPFFAPRTPIDASQPPFLIIFIKTFVICTFNAPILFFLHVLYNVISLNINNINTPKNKQNLPIHHHQTQWVNHWEGGDFEQKFDSSYNNFFSVWEH